MLTRSLILTLILSLTVASCNRPSANPTRAHPERLDIPLDEWVGIYVSPREISGFSGTVLVIEKSLVDGLSYRMSHYTDRRFANDIEQHELHGSCLTAGSSIFIPTASGYYNDDRKPQLSAAIDDTHWSR